MTTTIPYEVQLLEELISEEPTPRPSKRQRQVRKAREDRAAETAEERTARKSREQAARRAARKAEEAELGSVIRTADTTVRALADAAMVLLHEGGPAADRIQQLLEKVFTSQPGAPLSIRASCASRSLQPKHLRYPPMTDAERVRRLRSALL